MMSDACVSPGARPKDCHFGGEKCSELWLVRGRSARTFKHVSTTSERYERSKGHRYERSKDATKGSWPYYW